MTVSPPPRIREPDHVDWVCSERCCIFNCPGWPVQAHHVTPPMQGTRGRKAGDQWVVPLCVEHHAEVHNGKKTFARRYRVDLLEIAAEFARRSPVEKIRRNAGKVTADG